MKRLSLCKCGRQFICIWLAGLVGFGCAHTAPTAYFTLESGRQAPVDSDAAPVIVIKSVSVPDYLDNLLVTVREGSYRLERREFDHWAEPLEDAIARVLRDSLARALPKGNVVLDKNVRGDAARDGSLNVVVYSFDPDLRGNVCFSGRWEMRGGKRQPFTIKVKTPAGEPGVEHMVAGMSQAVDRLADEIVKKITGR